MNENQQALVNELQTLQSKEKHFLLENVLNFTWSDVEKSLVYLTEREKEVFDLYYGLIDGNKKNYEEVTLIFKTKEPKITSERIRQIHMKGLRKLLQRLEKQELLSIYDKKDDLQDYLRKKLDTKDVYVVKEEDSEEIYFNHNDDYFFGIINFSDPTKKSYYFDEEAFESAVQHVEYVHKIDRGILLKNFESVTNYIMQRGKLSLSKEDKIKYFVNCFLNEVDLDNYYGDKIEAFETNIVRQIYNYIIKEETDVLLKKASSVNDISHRNIFICNPIKVNRVEEYEKYFAAISNLIRLELDINAEKCPEKNERLRIIQEKISRFLANRKFKEHQIIKEAMFDDKEGLYKIDDFIELSEAYGIIHENLVISSLIENNKEYLLIEELISSIPENIIIEKYSQFGLSDGLSVDEKSKSHFEKEFKKICDKICRKQDGTLYTEIEIEQSLLKFVNAYYKKYDRSLEGLIEEGFFDSEDLGTVEDDSKPKR